MGSAKSFGCVGSTIRLRSGHYFDLANPQPWQFCLRDIAGGLSKICRFGGQIDRFYSVAEHSVHCANQAIKDSAPRAVQVAALLHDASEAFIGDVVKPLKNMLPAYAAIEQRISAVVGTRYDLCVAESTWDAVREIDHSMLIAERRALFSADKVVWSGENEVRALDVQFYCWQPAAAEFQFMEFARELGVHE